MSDYDAKTDPASFYEPLPEVFDPDECDRLVAESLPESLWMPHIHVRVDRVRRDRQAWVYDRIGTVVRAANDRAWAFDLNDFIEVRILHYDINGAIAWHRDNPNPRAPKATKLAASVLLSRRDEYDGGDLKFFGLKIGDWGIAETKAPLSERGDGICFPGWLCHQVSAVTRGKRVVLTARFGGPRFR